ncbi:response regulator transcription factor [Mucilaginibacter ginsenosidivorans]|uniref:Response regulator transcription factor n=1 Tax=Mucilaginibacter ginsenosidivorans TaxID=398053 RepID=A0A5B8UVR0_9SPHI|nr:response regulator transcription factor [Mucilaginibacter ginsenosidivorans]QEC62978.1 response regulator transcription factor [Mucilaginibacter ginsenosidivorans]
MTVIKIGLVDDHVLFRSGMKALLKENKKYSVMLEADNGEDLIKKLNKSTLPDVLILDTQMPKIDGGSTAKWLRNNFPQIKILVLTHQEDAETVLTMIRMGVKGYLLKNSSVEEFSDALLKVANNEIYYPEFVTRHLVHNINIDYNLAKLNSREVEFLKLSATELTYKEIAEHMCISSRTVEAYREQLFEKLQIKSRIGLVLYAIKNNIIEI